MLEPVRDALVVGDIVIFFPEGTRGEPECLGKLKTGIVWLVEQLPGYRFIRCDCPFGQGATQGHWLPVPFLCDAWVGETLRWQGDQSGFMAALVDEPQAAAVREGQI